MSDSPSQQSGRPASIGRELAQLLDRYAGPLVLYARQLCSDPEDAVQTAFVKLAQQTTLPKDRGAWLYRVVRNEALMQTRGDRRRRDREQAFAQSKALWFETDASGGLDAVIASEALAKLSQSQREIVVARIWGGLAFREIAQMLSLSLSSAHREYQQAIDLLQKEMNEPCPQPTNRT